MATKQSVFRPNGVVPNPDPSAMTWEAIEKAIANVEAKFEARIDGSESKLGMKIDGMQKAVEVFHADLTRVPTSVDRQILGLRELLEQRLHCMEDDAKGVHSFLDTRAADIKVQISHLRDLTFGEIAKVSELNSTQIAGATAIVIEKIKSLGDVTTQQFKSVVDTFGEKDKAVSVGLSTQSASAAAQQASNTEANNKMESNFTKLLDQGRELLAEVRRNTELQINDLKSGVSVLTARLDKGEGKTSVSDPAVADGMHRLAVMMADLSKSRDTTAGIGLSAEKMIPWAIAAGALAIALLKP